MSKYNLTDIFEQYRIGSGYTRDFDFAGMLKAGLETGVDTDIEILRKMSDDFEDVNYHRENNHLQKAIDALEEGAIKEASMFFGDFHAEIKSTMETFDMEIPDTLGGFMASKMEENTEAVDLAIEASQEKAGIKENENRYNVVDKSSGEIIDDDLPKQLALKLAAKKKGWVTKKSNKDKMNEVRIEKEVASRIEGLMHRELKRKFLFAFEDLWSDLIEEDPFYAEDVIAHLSNEMHKHLRGLKNTGDKLGIGLDQQEFTAIDEEDSIEEALPKFKGVPEKPSIIRALKVDGNGTKMEIDSYMASVKRSGDEFDDVDDYVEDFKNYVADKALQEHFGRFLKDYQ